MLIEERVHNYYGLILFCWKNLEIWSKCRALPSLTIVGNFLNYVKMWFELFELFSLFAINVVVSKKQNLAQGTSGNEDD